MPSTPIAVTEQATGHIVVLDSDADWASPAAVRWSWAPGEDAGLCDPQASWTCPDDVRLRRDPRSGRLVVLVCASGGLLAQVRYPEGGVPAWAVEVGSAPNPHGIELLPDGNIAAAASHGEWVRIYTAACAGSAAYEFVQAPLADAHQVLWDAGSEVLWGLGGTRLVKYRVGGSTCAPTLTRLTAATLPTRGGHDLQPDPHDPDRLWVTTVYGVHQFVKSTGRFVTDYRRRRELYAMNIKSIGTDPATGTVLQTTPAASDPYGWRTDRVDLFADTDPIVCKVLPDAGIYRARWFDPRAN